MKKKLAVLVLAGAMAVTPLAGCSSELKDSEVALTVSGDEVTADIANFYARYSQAQYETYFGSYYGEDMWGDVSEEGSYQNSVKDSLIEALENMYLYEDHMEEYDIEITEEDEAAIEKAAKEFMEANSADATSKVSGSQDTVEKVLRLFTIQSRMINAIYDTVDLEVSDEEAAQMKMKYVVFAFTNTDDDGNTIELTDDEKAALKVDAEGFAAEAEEAEDFDACAQEAGYEALEATFDAEETQTIPEELAKAAAALEEGGTTAVVEGDNGYYVARLVSAFDEEATETEKENIRSERKSEKLEEVLDVWREEAEITVNKKVWKKIDFDKLSVTMSVDETDDYTDDVVTDDVAESQSE